MVVADLFGILATDIAIHFYYTFPGSGCKEKPVIMNGGKKIRAAIRQP